MLDAFKDCHSGSHGWMEVSREYGAASDKVVRWCTVCGCVVVDEDYDGRTNHGMYVRITASDLYRKAAELLNA